MDIETLVAQFGQDSGLGKLSLNQDGLCRLVFGENLFVDIEKTEKNFVFHSVVGKPPVQQDEQLAFMEMLLEANAPINTVGDIHLGFDSKMDEILIFQNFADVEVDLDYFKACMDDFIAETSKWKSRLSSAWGQEELKSALPEVDAAKAKKETKTDKPKDKFTPPPGMIRG